MILSPLAGIRWMRLKATLSADGMSASQQETWAVPFVGASFSVDLRPRWVVTTEVDTGAGGVIFLQGQPAVLRAGYQVLHQDHKASDFHWDVMQYGPAAGLSVAFAR
jgi:hypothetical protein